MLETAQPKPRKRASVKRTKDRLEARIIKEVRAACVARDGKCRLSAESHAIAALRCSGWSEWAHMEGFRRFETRGKSPEERHRVLGSLMLCKKHHDMYDGRHPGIRLTITPLSERGADGPLKFASTQTDRPR